MLKYRLDKIKIEEEMGRRFLNLADLARLLGWSRQLTHHAINNGGKSFAPKLAAVLGIEPESIIISVRKGGPRQECYLTGTGTSKQPVGIITLTTGGEDVATKPIQKKKSTGVAKKVPVKKAAKK